MEQEIDRLKRVYLQIKPPMNSKDGFEDVLKRLEKDARNPFYAARTVIFTIIVILFIGAVGGTVIAATPNSPLYPIKEASLKTLQTLVPSLNLNTQLETVSPPRLAFPTPTPTIVPETQKTKPDFQNSENSNQGIQTSEIKKSQNPTTNDEKVKGAETQNRPATPNENAQNGQQIAEERRNEKANLNNSNSNPSSEKSNGKKN